MFFDKQTLEAVLTDKVKSQLNNRYREVQSGLEQPHRLHVGCTNSGYPSTYVQIPGETKARKVRAHHLYFQLNGKVPAPAQTTLGNQHPDGRLLCVCGGGNVDGVANISAQHRCLELTHWVWVPNDHTPANANGPQIAEVSATPAEEATTPVEEQTAASEAPEATESSTTDEQPAATRKTKKTKKAKIDNTPAEDQNGKQYTKKDGTPVTVADVRYIRNSDERIRDIAKSLNVTEGFVQDVFHERKLGNVQ